MSIAIFAAMFRKNNAGQTGLTVTISVEEIPVASGSPSAVISAQNMTESSNLDGIYWYRTGDIIDLNSHVYVAVASTAGDVDVPDIVCELVDLHESIKGATEYTYTIDDGSSPVEGAEVWISTDSAGANIIWYGTTDASGVARASDNEKPWLDAGTYYGWVQKGGYSFSNPDTLTVT